MYCIYRITNTINGKTYIGQHKYKDTPYDKYMGSGQYLANAKKKYGIENFKKDILVFNIVRKELIDLMEKQYIEIERLNPNGCYNIGPGGEGGNNWKYLSEERKAELNKRNSEAHKGKVFSEEHKRKIKENHAHYWEGKSHSEETKAKMRENSPHYWKGKHWVVTDETKRKIKENNPHYWKGKPFSEEHRKHLSEAHKGKPLSEETKRKMSEAQKKRWASKKGE